MSGGQSGMGDVVAKARAYANQLAAYWPDAAGVWICPTCDQYWKVEYLADCEKAGTLREMVTEGHVVPAALGGRKTVLECKNCNSRLGARGDSALAMIANETKWATEGAPLPVHLKFAGRTIPCDLRQTGPNQMSLTVALDAIDRDHAKRALDEFLAAPAPRHFSITQRRPSVKRIALGQLHLAHLAAFRAFGYEYRLSPAGVRCVKILAADRWPDDVCSFSVSGGRDERMELGDLLVIKNGLAPALAVCTAIGSDEQDLTVLPLFHTGEPHPILGRQRPESEEEITVVRVRDIPDFHLSIRPQPAWSLHRLMKRAEIAESAG